MAEVEMQLHLSVLSWDQPCRRGCSLTSTDHWSRVLLLAVSQTRKDLGRLQNRSSIPSSQSTLHLAHSVTPWKDSLEEEAALLPPGGTQAASSWFCRCYTGRWARGSPSSSFHFGRGPLWSGGLGRWSTYPLPPSRAFLWKGSPRIGSPKRVWPLLSPRSTGPINNNCKYTYIPSPLGYWSVPQTCQLQTHLTVKYHGTQGLGAHILNSSQPNHQHAITHPQVHSTNTHWASTMCQTLSCIFENLGWKDKASAIMKFMFPGKIN